MNDIQNKIVLNEIKSDESSKTLQEGNPLYDLLHDNLRNSLNSVKELKDSFSNVYHIQYNFSYKSEELVIVFSPGKSHILRNVNFDSDALYIVDSSF